MSLFLAAFKLYKALHESNGDRSHFTALTLDSVPYSIIPLIYIWISHTSSLRAGAGTGTGTGTWQGHRSDLRRRVRGAVVVGRERRCE